MKETIQKIFKEGYSQYKGDGTSKGTKVQNFIKELHGEINIDAIGYGMQTEFSVGIGRWAAVPWIRIFYTDSSPSAQDGVYIGYLFAASGKSVFVTLNQGTTDSSMEQRKRIREKIQEKIDPRQFYKNPGDLSFGDTKNYGEAAIFYKEYHYGNLPSNEDMKKDLQSMLEIYKECKDKGLIGNDITEEDSVLQNDTVDIKIDKNFSKTKSVDFNLLDFTSNSLHKSYILSLLAKPFVILTGNSGTGKTRIAMQFAKYLEKKNESGSTNHLLIPVGADWTDNTKILGFYNPLKKEYQSTPVLDFILLAAQNPEIPFFLILDEMNLSHVERYFSDFLSAMESGEPIPLYKKDADAESAIPEKITLPKNLFVTGTVNIDETTYMFSPKVLDRANVIEFKPEKDGVLALLLDDSASDEAVPAAPGVAEGFMQLANEVRSGKIPDGLSDVLNKIKPILDSVYTELEKCGFEFAYRTAKEIRLYAVAAFKTAEKDSLPTATEIADIQILQKILPKIHGNKKQIGGLLENLETLCKEKSLSDSLAKIRQMKTKLNNFQYASFI